MAFYIRPTAHKIAARKPQARPNKYTPTIQHPKIMLEREAGMLDLRDVENQRKKTNLKDTNGLYSCQRV